MLLFEQLSLAYFAGSTAALLFVPGSRRMRLAASGAAAASAALVWYAARVLPLDARLWLGHLYLLLGYWIPAWPVLRGTVSRFERWLAGTETIWRPHLDALPSSLVLVGEAAYLMCYPMLPAGFVIVWILGEPVDVNRFWVAALGSGLFCYVMTPWLSARPPRLLALTAASENPLARLNAALLNRLSHNLTTFPSGHVAVAAATAISLAAVSASAAVLFAILAAGIAVGAAAGRYHYVVDVAAGLVVGVAIGLLAFGLAPAV